MDAKRLWRLALYTGGGLLLLIIYSVSYQVTQINIPALFTNLPKGRAIVSDFLSPDLTARAVTTTTIELAFPIPCDSAPISTTVTSGPRLTTNVPCAAARDKFTLEGYELSPNAALAIRWLFPDGRVLTAVRSETDDTGHFSTSVEARQIAAAVNGVASRLQVEVAVPVGGLIPSTAFKDVTNALFVTLFMAWLATSGAAVIAAPLSFLAASNITKHGAVGNGVYYFSRFFFNLTRSYDPLVMATVFGFWVGFGPFAGTLALMVVTVASFGKLFSEAIENIDPGPLEALSATGANRLQVILYAVVPQIIPDFISFIIYHWDINVRISTIIGFVGGGGLGYYLKQRIDEFHYHQAGTAIWAIVIVVWAMDFLSAEVRKRYT